MTASADKLAQLLASSAEPVRFSAFRTLPVDSLQIEVQGLGPLELPVSEVQARRLCQLGRPARYGRGEQTLLDPAVRDTSEIPKSRVKIDKRTWNRSLLPVLERLGADLGLPPGGRLASPPKPPVQYPVQEVGYEDNELHRVSSPLCRSVG